MKMFSQSARRIALSTISNPSRRMRSARLLAWMGLVFVPTALFPALPAHAEGHYVPGHLYLGVPNGDTTDVTSAYVQTGSVYDAQKGHTVQTGYITQSSGNIDVTVDINEGDVEDWDHHRIGFVGQSDLPDDIKTP